MKSVIDQYRIFFVRLQASLLHQILILFGIFQIYKDTNSPVLAGLMGLFLFVPTMVIPLFVAKHIKRMQEVGKLFFLTQALYFFAVLILLFNTNENLIVWYVAAFFASIARALRVPLHYSIVKLAPQCSHKKAQLNNLSWQVPIVLAPLIVSGMGEGLSPLFLKTFMVLLSASILWMSAPLRRYRLKGSSEERDVKLIKNLKNQLSGTQSIWLPALADVLIMIFASLPILMTTIIFENGFPNSYFGPLISFPMLITILSVIFIAPRLSRMNRKLVLGVCFSGIACGMILLLFSSHLIILVLGLFVVAAFDGVSIVVRDELLISNSRETNVGLVASLNAILISASDELGGSLSGIAVELGGSHLNLILSACLGALVGSFYIFHFIKNSKSEKFGLAQTLIQTQKP